MDFYKKIIRNQALRFRILSMLRFVPDKPMLKLQYRIKCGRPLNLADPQRYTEKMQWYKLFYRDPLMRRCADKFQVRGYLEEKGYGYLLNELYAVFERPEDISLDLLPEAFVLKVSNGSSTNLLCPNKADLDLTKVKKQFREFLIQSNSNAGCEWVYNDGKPVIIAERYLTDPEQANGSLRDYKILCFSGKPEYIICVDGRHTDRYCHVVYDTAWKKQQVVIGESSADADYPRPVNLDQMLAIAEDLSKDFPAARIDLYSIAGKLYFGEITFFPWSGFMHFRPDSFDAILGEKFRLPKKKHI